MRGASDGLDEACVLTVSLCRKYANNPKATAETITPDGWLRTGDVAVADRGGYLQITDRIKDFIKYKGFQGMFALLRARS